MKEEHEKQFGGTYNSDYVWEALETNQITTTEFVLLARVDSLSKLKLGCIASNEFLGKVLHCTSHHVSKMMGNLVDLGLIVQLGFDGRKRRITPCWRVPPKRLKEHSECSLKNMQHMHKRTGRVSFKEHIDSIEDRKHKDRKHMSGAAPRKHNGFLDLNGINQSSKEYIWFDKLRTAVRHSRKIEHQRGIDDKKWINEFSQLLIETNNDYERIDKALEWYLPKMGKIQIGKIYIPQIFSATAFREKFDKVEFAMQALPFKISKIDLSDELKPIYQFLIETYKWPNGSKSDLSFVLHKSWENYHEFMVKYKKWKLSDDMSAIVPLLIENELIQKSSSFLVNWFKWVNEQIIGREGWSGKLENYIWNIDHSIYVKRVINILGNNSISSNDWEKFKLDLK